MKTSRLILLAASLLLLAGCNSNSRSPLRPASPAPTTPPAKSPVTITPSANEPSHSWTDEQILTCTVTQCWRLGGKTEEGYFDIIQQLAVISARNRNLSLPEDEKAGEKTGEYIKAEAHKDHEQLLFALVDAAVRKVGTPNPSN
ncbi:MAG TPA: hypothetical protein VK578_16830 [Edaphobacter sp.]|jgi:hypothetical protein|nr:hypothetical protein [Edaphobacter sp.]